MKKIYQTKFGETEGNCTAAAIASLLGISIDDVPEIIATDHTWIDELNEFLFTLGLYAVSVDARPESKRMLHGFHLIGGKSLRGDFGHYIVGHDGEEWFDVHPSGDWLEEVEDYLILVSLDPSRIAKRVRWIRRKRRVIEWFSARWSHFRSEICPCISFVSLLCFIVGSLAYILLDLENDFAKGVLIIALCILFGTILLSKF